MSRNNQHPNRNNAHVQYCILRAESCSKLCVYL